MPKRVSDSELGPILAIFTEIPQPAALEEIHARLGKDTARRTLQRRLAALVVHGRLLAEGDRGGRRYRAADAAAFAPIGVQEPPAPYGAGIQLSSTAEEIRRNVLRPLTSRRPVGYQSAFLKDYRPNESAYLLPEHLAKLAALGGRLPGAPQPAGTYFRKVMDRLLIDLSWNSSRLEGNTYSRLETERLLLQGQSTEGRASEESRMILNHKAAIEMLAEQAEEIGFNRYTLCNLHALLADNLLPDPRSGGRLRDCAVGISASVYHPPEGPQVLEEHFQLLLDKAAAIENPFEQAFFVMVQLPYLQPFEDVNKRVSRLAANIPLLRHNLCPLSFVDVPQSDYVNAILGVYELNRIEYLREVFLWAYDRSCARYAAVRQTLGEPDPFRLRYRVQLGELVTEVVRSRKSKAGAAKWIAGQAAARIAAADRARFIEAVETELSSLHEGNIARHRLRPSEYHTWKVIWE